jgi:D-threo-aldose 1-dehydrogenase
MRRAPLDCILLAGRYSLLDRSAEAELIPLCRERQTSLVIGGVFNSGILATGAKPGAHFDYGAAPRAVLDKVRAMEEIAAQGGYPLAAAALQFPLAEPSVATVLIGTAKASSLERNMKLLETTIPVAEYGRYGRHIIVQPPLTGAVRE